MLTEEIRCVPIWSGWVRLTHWLIAAGVLFQMLSAQAIAWGASDYTFWHDWHVICGQLLLVSVAARVILLFILPASGSWRAFLPDQALWRGAVQMLRFYLSFARTPLPNWFAHNPLWRLLYPLLWLLLIAAGVSGLLYNTTYSIAGMYMHEFHTAIAQGITAFTVLHLLAVFLHDLKGKSAAISGMINGLRYFHVAKSQTPAPNSPFKGNTPPVYVAVENIKKCKTS